MSSISPFADPWQKFIDEFGESPALSGSLEDISKQWNDIFQKLAARYTFQAPDESVTTQDITVSDFWVRTYTPPLARGNEPLVIYFHGGGWVLGNVDQEDSICRMVSNQCQARVVSVEYRLAPAHKSPAALDDCVAAAKWALDHFSAENVTLMGCSAGGNLAFGSALRLIDEGKSQVVKGVVAVVPVTVHPDVVPVSQKSRYTSYEEHAIHTINTASAMQTFLKTYDASSTDAYFSVLLHPRLQALRKVYMVESGTDTLRDDARLMKEALEQNGVYLKYDDYPGYPHYSWTFPSDCLAEHRQDFNAKLVEGVKFVITS